jgi:periplasmic protein TonB
MNNTTDKLDKGIALSVGFHALFVGFVLFSSSLFPTQGDASWGTEKGGAGGIDIKMVGNLSGVPLPSPEVVRENTVANESEGLYSSPPAPEPPATPDKAEPVPETTAPVKVTPKPAAPSTPPRSTKTDEPADTPPNAVPFGQGGKPAMSYGSYQTGAGQAGVAIGDGTFGTQYGYYVDAMTRRISQNWLQALISTQVNRAPRVYLNFEIARDGTISNAEIKQGSGIPSLDNSALRAIRASSPLSPLPAGYRGSSVTVSFYFEYVR